MEELCENLPLLKAYMTAKVLTAMLLASETKEELNILQFVAEQANKINKLVLTGCN